MLRAQGRGRRASSVGGAPEPSINKTKWQNLLQKHKSGNSSSDVESNVGNPSGVTSGITYGGLSEVVTEVMKRYICGL